MRRREFLTRVASAAMISPLVSDPVQLKSPPPPRSVCDIHVHLVGMSTANGCYVSRRTRRTLAYHLEKWFILGRENGTEEEADRRVADRLISAIESSPLHSRAVLLAIDGIYEPSGALDAKRTAVHIPSDYVFSVCKRSAKLVPGASIHPFRPDALDEIDRVADLGAVLVKWIPNSQIFDPSDPRCRPFYRKLVQRNLPLLSHCGIELALPSPDHSLGDPSRLRQALEEGVTVILAHAGGEGRSRGESYFSHVVAMMRDYPNLFMDSSAILMPHKVSRLRYLLDHPEWFGRVIYGSDYPLLFFPVVSPFYLVGELSLREAWALENEDNPLVRDVRILWEAGVPLDVFGRGLEFLRR